MSTTALSTDQVKPTMLVSRSGLPTVEQLKELLSYDPETGIVVWRKNAGGKSKIGPIHTGLNESGYLRIGIRGFRTRLHRVAWALFYGDWPPATIDHKNGNPSDNRIRNLRIATTSENAQNVKMHTDNRSGVKGVSFEAGKWRAKIMAAGKRTHLGRFLTKQEAEAAYREAAVRLHKDFARLE